MQLKPLHSRLAASLASSVLLFQSQPCLFSPNPFAAAADTVYNVNGMPTNLDVLTLTPEQREIPHYKYQGDFDAFDRDILGSRPEEGTTSLENNVATVVSLKRGTTAYFVLKKNTIFGSRPSPGDASVPDEGSREKTVFLSATTCRHPEKKARPEKDDDGTVDSFFEAPQLTMYISTSDANTFPGPGGSTDDVAVPFVEGAIMQEVDADGTVYFSISAPAVSAGVDGEWTIEVAVSLDDFYHSYYGGTPSQISFVNSDATSALLRTRDLGLTVDVPDDGLVAARAAIQDDPAYALFVAKRDSPRLNGVRRSFCGLRNYADMTTDPFATRGQPFTVISTITGKAQAPRHQYHFQGLDPGSEYTGILVHTGRKSLAKRVLAEINGGGRVFEARQFETKTGENCKILTNLEFCQDITYPVPANDNKLNDSALAQFYDDYARRMYGFFEKNLAQIQCDAPDESRYSPVRNCGDCATAYRNWLCSVTIPRCEDFSSPNQFAVARNVAQAFPNGSTLAPDVAAQFASPGARTSRNAVIDEQVSPGPYREILPCEDICHELVRSCPAALRLTCPTRGMYGFNTSYGMLEGGGDGVSCNLAGKGPERSGGGRRLSFAVSYPLIMAIVFIFIWD